MVGVLLLMLSGCSLITPEFDRAKFENEWWELAEYPVCFNFHESGDVLLYEENISNEGSWHYCEPNIYEFDEGQEIITVEPEEECWAVKGYSRRASFVACECTLR